MNLQEEFPVWFSETRISSEGEVHHERETRRDGWSLTVINANWLRAFFQRILEWSRSKLRTLSLCRYPFWCKMSALKISFQVSYHRVCEEYYTHSDSIERACENSLLEAINIFFLSKKEEYVKDLKRFWQLCLITIQIVSDIISLKVWLRILSHCL